MTLAALARYTLAAAAVGVAAMAGVMVGQGAPEAGPTTGVRPPARPPVRQPPLVEATRPVIRHTRGDTLAWQAKLRRLQLTAGGKALAAGSLDEAVIYDRQGRAAVRVVAQGVKGQADQKDFVIEGPVHAVAERGAVLQASRVEWVDDAEPWLSRAGTVKPREIVKYTNRCRFGVGNAVCFRRPPMCISRRSPILMPPTTDNSIPLNVR